MTLVARALNLGEKMKIYIHVLTSFHKTSNLAISRCCFADDGKEMDKSEKRTCRACYCFCPLNMQICDVLVVVAVVAA